MTRILMIAAVLLIAASANGQSQRDAMQACANEQDDAARLACYDRAFGDEAEPAVAPAAAVVEARPTPAAPPVQPPAPEPEPQPEAAPEYAPASAPAPVSSVESFGLDPERQAKEEEIREISATVTDIRKRTRGQYVVTLDNGQVWTEKDAEPYLRIRVGDTIVIKRLRFGGYRLVARGNRASAVVRLE